MITIPAAISAAGAAVGAAVGAAAVAVVGVTAVAVVPGAVVWSVIGGSLALWLLATHLAGPQRLPRIVEVVRWFLQCWTGRTLLMAAWAGAGWHLFCQRP